MRNEKKFAKLILADAGIKVYQKDVKSVILHKMATQEHKAGEGLDPDYMHHRELIKVTMNDGNEYEILRETVDKEGNFSTNSAYWMIKDIKTN